MNVNNDHPILILMRGLPGSGKSYLAQRLVDSLDKEKVIMLDPDATDYNSDEYKQHTKQLSEEGVDPKLHAYRFLRAKAYDGIANKKIIIWNQPFTNLEIFKKMIKRMEDHASSHSVNLSIVIVEVKVDPTLAKERVAERKRQGGHGPSDDTFTRFLNDYSSFAHLGFETVQVRGDNDVETSVSSVLETLRSL